MPKPGGEGGAPGGGITLARIAGTLFIILLWTGAWFFRGALSLMGTLMANDGGGSSGDAHTAMILAMMGGQVLAGAAGVPLGLSLSWRRQRRPLLSIFAGLLLAGLVAQGLAVYAFFLGFSPA